MFRIGRKKSSVQSDKNNSREVARKRGPTRAQGKIAKRISGKDTGRHIFGFACSTDIQASLKLISEKMNVPLFAMAEHAIQLGAIQIADANNDPEERELLRQHLTEDHVAMRTIEKVARYDEETAEEMHIARIRRFEEDRVVRRLVADFIRKGMPSKYMAGYFVYGCRCFTAYVNGSPMPKPQKEYFQ